MFFLFFWLRKWPGFLCLHVSGEERALKKKKTPKCNKAICLRRCTTTKGKGKKPSIARERHVASIILAHNHRSSSGRSESERTPRERSRDVCIGETERERHSSPPLVPAGKEIPPARQTRRGINKNTYTDACK